MCFFFSSLPAKVWAVVGYFILFSSTRTEGGVQIVGKVLAIWVFIIAVFIPIAGACVTIANLCPLESILETILGEGSS
jgi:hypothetical protein